MTAAKMRMGAALSTVVAVAVLFPIVFTNPTFTTIAIWTLIYVIGATAWNIFSGYTGYFSFSHAAFYGIGAYTVALLAEAWKIPGGYSMFLLLPVGGLVAGIASIPIGLFALRTRQMVFAMVTIAVFFSGQLLAFNLRGITHGASGVESPIADWSSSFYNIPFYYVALLVAVLAVCTSWAIRRSRFGLGLLAIRDDEDRAVGLGVPATTAKLVAFFISGSLLGMAGGIYALFAGSIYPQFAFDPIFDAVVLTCVLVGGIGTLSGPIAGALILIPLQQSFIVFTGSSNWFLIIQGALFLIVVLYMPAGILPSVAAYARDWLVRRRGGHNGTRPKAGVTVNAPPPVATR
jgi:branched-chain amino acid transport system permease protein